MLGIVVCFFYIINGMGGDFGFDVVVVDKSTFSVIGSATQHQLISSAEK